MSNYSRSVVFIVILLLSCASLLFGEDAFAGQEYRKPSLTWRLWGGDAADFDSPEAAFSARNAAAAAVFDACSAKNCRSCIKESYAASSQLGPYPAIINGRLISVGSDGGVTTFYSSACTIDYGGGDVRTTPASGPSTSATNGGIAAFAIQRCPSGWGIARNRSLESQTIDGQLVPVLEQDCGKKVPHPCTYCTSFGNPIDAVAASKLASETDYISADGALAVRRTYSSAAGQWSWGHDDSLVDFTGRNTSLPLSSILSGYISAFPAGMYSYFSLPVPPAVARAQSWPLVAVDWNKPQKEASVLANGRRTVFVEGGLNEFSTIALKRPALSVATVAGTPQWTFRSPERGFDIFDSGGLLVRRVTRDGKSTTYSRQGSSMTVTAYPSGRTLFYSATSPKTPFGSYDTIVLPNGTSLRYEFDSVGLVGAVNYPDAKRTVRVYDEATYTGTDERKSWLTGLIDEHGVRQATYAYSGDSPQSTELAGGVGRYTFEFGSSFTNVTSPAPGGVRTLHWENGPDGERRLTNWLQPAGAGSGMSWKSITYDSGGNTASESKFNTGLVCYLNDLERNLPIARIDGLTNGVNCSRYTEANAPLLAGVRKVSTEWHSDWQLKKRIAEPGRITTNVYNGQPDPFNNNALAFCAPSTALLPDGKPIAVLCKQVQQATTDTNGQLGFSAALQSGVPNRVQLLTYNHYGQVLTAKDPRNNTTTYVYYSDTNFTGTNPNAVGHSIGDLRTVTNAMGQITTYTKYSKHGELLQSIDPNGVLTTNTYDLRQRILSSTVGGQTTDYTYDAAGQLLKTTAADGSWTGYAYDPAHRMKAVTDSRGNRIEYTLDNAGAITAQAVKDPSGALRRSLTQSRDALGRVQQTVGAP